MSKKLTIEDIRKRVTSIPEIRLISETYLGRNIKLEFECLLCGNPFGKSWNGICAGQRCPKCTKKKIRERRVLKLEDVINRVKKLNPNIQILSAEYVDAHGKLDCLCLLDNHQFPKSWAELSQGQGCPACAGRVVSDKNRVSILRKDLIKYFKNPKDADNYSIGSIKLVDGICPECGFEKPIMPNTLYYQGFSCKKCGDGISIPNKFVFNVLSQINVDFIPEKSFEWSQNKRYDFYIPSLNMIIEVHGEQHYRHPGRGRSLEEEQKNDEIKEILAKKNDIKHYITVDCSNSSIDYLQEKVKQAFYMYFNLDTIIWEEVYNYCTSSLMVKAWDLINFGFTTTEIAKILKVTDCTVVRYLKNGNKMGKTNYIPYQSIRNKVNQYTLDGIYLNSYESNIDAMNKTGVNKSKIAKACKGIEESAGGFIWKYDDEKYIPRRNKSAERQITQSTLDGVFICEYPSLVAAEIKTGIKAGNISQVVSGRNSHAGGFKWSYKI